MLFRERAGVAIRNGRFDRSEAHQPHATRFPIMQPKHALPSMYYVAALPLNACLGCLLRGPCHVLSLPSWIMPKEDKLLIF